MTGQQAGTTEAEIRALVRAAHEAQDDVEALMRLHADDVSIVNIAGRRLFGKDAFREAMTQALAGELRQVPTSVTVDRIAMLSDTAAVVSCTKTVHDERGPESTTRLPAALGRLSYVVARGPAGWRIAAAQTTPVAEPA